MVKDNCIFTTLRMKLGLFLTPPTKINSKWIKDWNVRPGPWNKLLEEKLRINYLTCFPVRVFFWIWRLKHKQQIKNKPVGLYQTNKLLHSKETINKVKRKPVEWGKNFANHISDKGVYPKHIKNSYNSIPKKQITQLKIRQRTQIGISPKKMYERPIYKLKDVLFNITSH